MRNQVSSTAVLAGMVFATVATPAAPGAILINEIDSDTANVAPGTDNFEFIELYSTTGGVESLDNLTVALFNGNQGNNRSYLVFDLNGRSTNADGFFTIGAAANFAAGVIDLDAPPDSIQNGPDAVGLYTGDFATNTNPTTANLLDAVVYGTDDPDDIDLLAALGETVQYNEGAHGGSGTPISLSRFPDGSGDFVRASPTPGDPNLPEPTSLAMLALAGGAAIVRRRR